VTLRRKFDFEGQDQQALVLNEEINKKLTEASRELLTSFFTLIRTTSFHAFSNEATRQIIQKMLPKLQTLLEQDYEIYIEHTGTDFIVNERWIKLLPQLHEMFANLGKLFAERELGALRITFLPNEKQLVEFVRIFLSVRPGTGQPFSVLQNLLWHHRVSWISIEPFEEGVVYDVKRVNMRAFTRQVYFHAIEVTRQLYHQAAQKKSLKLKSAKRVVQFFVDLFLDTGPDPQTDFLLLLTHVKNWLGYRYNHAVNVCILTLGQAQRLGIPRAELRDLGIAALLYDIGFASFPEQLMEKEELSTTEREQIHRHSAIAVPLLLNTTFIDSAILKAVCVAFTHHLGAVQGGYPDYAWGLQSLSSQLVSIADRYDALTTPRPYRSKAIPPPLALFELARSSSKELHPNLVRHFLDWMGSYPPCTFVRLNTGEIGYVIGLPRNESLPDAPPLRLISQNRLGAFVDLSQCDRQGNRLRSIVQLLDPFEENLHHFHIRDILAS